MKRMLRLVLFLAALCAALHAEDQQSARIGDLKLENGEVIRDCVVGYRTFGTENPQESNGVVFPTYLGGRSADLASQRISPAGRILVRLSGPRWTNARNRLFPQPAGTLRELGGPRGLVGPQTMREHLSNIDQTTSSCNASSSGKKVPHAW
jgi:homoserine acetyltransferase